MICAQICGRLKSLLKNMHIVSMGSRDYKRMEVREADNNPLTILNICVQHCSLHVSYNKISQMCSRIMEHI